MKRLLWVFGILLVCLAGCGQKDDGVDPTIPPYLPDHQIAGSTLPGKIAGYTALGAAPVAQQMSATYARDTQPLDLVVVTFDPSGDFGTVSLSNQQWYGVSRCGIMWKGDAKQTPQPTQSACVTVLVDGVMTTVSGGEQTPDDLAGLANAIYKTLA